MADVLMLQALQNLSYLQQIITKCGAKLWEVPHCNLSYSIDEYKQKIKDIGFKLIKTELLGDRVIPGYCNFNLTLSVMREQAKVRGPFVGYVGGPMIDIFVKKAFSQEIIEYIFVVAEKEVKK